MATGGYKYDCEVPLLMVLLAARPARASRFQPFVSKEDHDWIESVCGHEVHKAFRDVHGLFHHLLRLGEARIERLRREGRVPRIKPGDWSIRLQVLVSPERGQQLRRDIGTGDQAIYGSPSLYAADLIRMGRLFVPLLVDLEQRVAAQYRETPAPRTA